MAERFDPTAPAVAGVDAAVVAAAALARLEGCTEDERRLFALEVVGSTDRLRPLGVAERSGVLPERDSAAEFAFVSAGTGFPGVVLPGFLDTDVSRPVVPVAGAADLPLCGEAKPCLPRAATSPAAAAAAAFLRFSAVRPLLLPLLPARFRGDFCRPMVGDSLGLLRVLLADTVEVTDLLSS